MRVALKGLRIILSSRILGNLATLSLRSPLMSLYVLTNVNSNRTPNMFSFSPCSDHLARKRIFASAYSRSSIHGPHVQRILRTRTEKLIHFLSNQLAAKSTGKSGHLVPRNLIRPLGTDIFTAFAFSEAEGTKFLDELRAGANTMEELGMEIWELWHEDKRDSSFFFESQPEFKSFSNFLAPLGRRNHVRFEAWVVSVMKLYETRMSCLGLEDEGRGDLERGIYWRLLTNTSSKARRQLSWRERASEIMDHMGTHGFSSLSSSTRAPCIKFRSLSNIHTKIGN